VTSDHGAITATTCPGRGSDGTGRGSDGNMDERTVTMVISYMMGGL
jgi:hypothetical protein